MIAPRVLFVPVSGPGGTGEYFRCLILADAIRQRWPEATVRFIANRHAGFANRIPYPADLIDKSPTHDVAGVNKVIERERPHLVVFDSSGRRAQYASARRVGARVVYISSRFKTRWKGFRWRRMRLIDQHWMIQPRVLGNELSWVERLKCRLTPSCEAIALDTLFREPTARDFSALSLRLQLPEDGYAVFCSGGGGSFAHAVDPASVYLDAARRFASESKFPTVFVAGPNAAATADVAGVQVVGTLPNAELLALIQHSAFAVVNGGSLLPQTLALGQACVAAPIAADQNARIRQFAQRGATMEAGLNATQLAEAALALARDAAKRKSLRDGARLLGLTNGVKRALDEVERLLAAKASRA